MRLAIALLVSSLAVSAGPAFAEEARATFAGGCFWCMEPPFDKLEGVTATISGYAGGDELNPTYGDVSAGRTGHLEVVQIVYDPAKVSYETLLHVFWRNIDPFQDNGQFCDRGNQYRTAVFAHDAKQRRLAEQSKAALGERFDQPIVTRTLDMAAFYPAEDYHQDFYMKDPRHYKRYRVGCGRDRQLERIWGEEAGGGH